MRGRRSWLVVVLALSMSVAAVSVVGAQPTSIPHGVSSHGLPWYTGLICEGSADATHELLEGVLLAEARPDYLALRSVRGYEHSIGKYTWFPNGQLAAGAGTLLASTGARCRDGVATCNDVDELEVPASIRSGADSLAPFYLVMRRGRTWSSVATRTELRRVLGSVDSLREAALVATLQGYRIRCGFSTGERSEHGWRLTAERAYRECGAEPDRYALEVSVKGDVQITAMVPHPPVRAACAHD